MTVTISALLSQMFCSDLVFIYRKTSPSLTLKNALTVGDGVAIIKVIENPTMIDELIVHFDFRSKSSPRIVGRLLSELLLASLELLIH